MSKFTDDLEKRMKMEKTLDSKIEDANLIIENIRRAISRLDTIYDRATAVLATCQLYIIDSKYGGNIVSQLSCKESRSEQNPLDYIQKDMQYCIEEMQDIALCLIKNEY